jgi:hypothetical protein
MFRRPIGPRPGLKNRRATLRTWARPALEALEPRLTPTTFNVPSQYATISQALAAASDGDTILMDPSKGPYSDQGDHSLTIKKAVTLDSSTPGVNAVIDCAVGNFAYLMDSGIAINHLTIENSKRIAVSADAVGFFSFDGCDFESNSSADSQAAVGFIGGAAGTFSHCTFNGNTGQSVVGTSGSPASFDNCVFTNNTSNPDGGSGAIGGYGNMTLTSCTFRGNKGGGGSEAGAIRWLSGTLLISQCSFINNSSPGAGAISLDSVYGPSQITISQSIFANNSAKRGAILESETEKGINLIVTDCLFTGNSASDGAALEIILASAPELVSANIINCSFCGNITTGGALTGTISSPNARTSLTITNSILYGDSTPNEISTGTSVNIDHSDIDGGFAGPRNINADPLFSSPADGDFHLQLDSPAIGMGTADGTPAADLNGDAWGNQNSKPNMGAFTVVPIVADFAIDAPPAATAGKSFTFKVTAENANDDIVSAYSGKVHFTSSDGAAALPADMTLSNGTGTFTATLDTAGNQTITATEKQNSTITGTSSVAVQAAAATHFRVIAPGSATAGAPCNVTVTALDAFNNTATAYNGAVHLKSSDGQAVFPANPTLSNGIGAFSVTLATAGKQTITATDTQSSSITGTSGSVVVSAAAAAHFTVIAPGSTVAGHAFVFTVTAQDRFNNTATAYNGTVHFTSSDGQAALPANTKLTNGTGAFNATLATAGNQTITATDMQAFTILGSSNPVVVSAAAATHFAVRTPNSANAGSAFSMTVTALDQFGNTVTGYSGTVHFTSSDGAATLPVDGKLTSGTGAFSAILGAAGNQTITATDTQLPTFTGTSSTIVVGAAAATRFAVSTPSTAAAGSAFSITVTALDQLGNNVTGYTGTVHFTSSDGAATLPADTPLTNGTGTFSATLYTAGDQTITATDTQTSSFTGSSSAVAVSAAAATHFAVSTPSSATAGSVFSMTVTALDQVGNTVAGYTGTVHFTSSDGQAALPADHPINKWCGRLQRDA